MLILGIDPGTINCGYGCIEYLSNTVKLIDSGVIKIPTGITMPEKIGIIFREIKIKIIEHKPGQIAVETSFFGRNIQSALKLGYARGAAIAAAADTLIPVFEYSPREIKKAVTGRGGAAKEQVSYMVKLLTNTPEELIIDESDAIATAICHAFSTRKGTGSAKSWTDFVKLNPGKIV